MADGLQSVQQQQANERGGTNVSRSSGSTGDERRRFRGSYRAGWSVCANTVIAAGVVSALASWGWPVPTAAVASVTFIVVVIAAEMLPSGGHFPLRKVLCRGLYAGTVLTAAAGLTVVFGTLGLLLVLLLTGTAPGLRAACRRTWRFLTSDSNGGAWEEQLDEREAPPPRIPVELVPPNQTPWLPVRLDSLDDVSLCMAWRSSYIALEAAASIEQRIAVIEHRQRCLDELQRRSPQGVAAWLSSGARASGNPLPYLGDRQ
jgi:hypothetical protein